MLLSQKYRQWGSRQPNGKFMLVQAGAVHEVQGSINGTPVLKASIAGSFKTQTADIVFQVPRMEGLSELAGCTFDLSVGLLKLE